MDINIFDKIISEIENGNFVNAIQHCDELLNENPDNRSVYEIRSGCYYSIGDYDSAIRDLTYSIVKIHSGKDSTDEIIGLYGKRGKIFLKKSEWLKASEDYKKILALNQNIPEIQNSLALCYRKLENYIDALYHSSLAIKLNNEYAEAYNNRANINICMEKYQEAISDYTRSIELNPLSANVYFNRGSIYYDILNKKDNALQDFLKAININPNFKEELENRYPDLINTLDNKKESTEEYIPPKETIIDLPIIPEIVIPKQEDIPHKEVVIDPPKIPEIVVPKQEDTDIGFSLNDFASLFNDKKDSKTGPVFPASEEINKTDGNVKPDFASLLDEKKDDKIEPVIPTIFESFPQSNEEVKKSEEIVIPEFDLKSIFSNTIETEEISPTELESSFPGRPVISNDIKLLHDEIQAGGEKVKEPSELVSGVNFGDMSHFENKEPVFDTDTFSKYVPKREEKRRSFLRSPVFFIILIFLMAIIILLSVLKFFKSRENQIVNIPAEIKVDSSTVKNTDTLKEVIKDTVTQKQQIEKSETYIDEEMKPDNVPTKEVKPETKLTTKNFGYISDKKQFVLFSEPDGYYVQIGSYKEKSKADEKLKLLEKNGLKGKISEVDLKEKGIFYRVRVGVFLTPEEAKRENY